MEQALALDQGYNPGLAAVQEVVGNFKPVDAVTFEGMAPILPAAEEEDNGNNADEPPPPKARRSSDESPKVKAKVREEADAAGSTAVKNKQPTRRAGFLRNLFR
jgi:hypothetical protein